LTLPHLQTSVGLRTVNAYYGVLEKHLEACFDFHAELFNKWRERHIFIGLAGEGDIAGYNDDYMVYLVWNLSQARSHRGSGLERGRYFEVDITDMEYYESHVFPLLACCIQMSNGAGS